MKVPGNSSVFTEMNMSKSLVFLWNKFRVLEDA